MSQLALAVLAGLLTVAAPCILPLLPILLGASLGQTGRARPALIALGFVLAFSACALAFGLFAHVLGLTQDTLRTAAIVLLSVFGLLMLDKRPFELLARRMGPLLNGATALGQRAGNGHAGALLLGLTLGVLWTPCAGPVLGAILTLIATEQDLRRASVLLLGYAAGAGIPMLLIAYGGQLASQRVRTVARYSARLQQGFGVVVLLTAVAMYYQYDTLITVWLSDLYPAFLQGISP